MIEIIFFVAGLCIGYAVRWFQTDKEPVPQIPPPPDATCMTPGYRVPHKWTRWYDWGIVDQERRCTVCGYAERRCPSKR